MKTRTIVLGGVAVLLLLGADVHATIVRVPEDEANIAAGLAAASDGDTVLVACGTYYENDIHLKSGVTLTSASGEADCVTIDAEEVGRVFWCVGVSSPARLVGFTATHGMPDDSYGGGGMYCADSDLEIENCVFASNRAGRGAGMRCDSGASPEITECVFLENNWGHINGDNGGGMECSPGSSPTLQDVDFIRNFVLDNGAGMWCEGATPTLTRVSFVDNWSLNERGGGLMCEEGASPVLEEVLFSGNRAVHGGGLYADECPSFTVENCTFFGNVADSRGGGLYLRGGSSPLVSGTTIVANSATHGSGVHCYGESHPQFANCIIAFGGNGEAVYCFPDGGCLPALSCCDVYGNEGGDWVDCIADQYGVLGNFSANPLFCDAITGDLTLHADSPCSPGQSGGCGLIGAWDVGCDPTPVESGSWGSIKARFR